MNKKSIIIIILVLLVIITSGLFLMNRKINVPVKEKEENQVEQSDEYKNVNVNSGRIIFSFEIPQNWIVETRNSRNKEMPEEEMRDFLATSYEKNPRDLPDEIVSDYANLTWGEIGKMGLQEMKNLMSNREKNLGFLYPNASVSSGKIIGYLGPNRYQVDFYVLSEKRAIELKNDLGSQLGIEKKNIIIAGEEAEIYEYSTDKDENGNPVFSPGASGGTDYFINTRNSGNYLLIKKQALGEKEYEQSFQHILESLSIN